MAPATKTDKPHATPEEQHSRAAEAAGVGTATAIGAESAAGQLGPADRATTGDRVPSESQTKDAEKLSMHAVTPHPSAMPEGHGQEAQARDQPRGETAVGAAATVASDTGGASGLSKNDYDHELKSQETQQRKPEETRSNIRDVTSEEGVKHTHKPGAGAGDYDTGYHPAKMFPPPTGERADQSQPGSPVSPTSTATANVSDSPKERRVGFLHKVRGEAKIIAGKVSGKEDKVEEGKRIIHGEL